MRLALYGEKQQCYESTGIQATPAMHDKAAQWEDPSFLQQQEYSYCKGYTVTTSLTTQGTQTVAVPLHQTLSKADIQFYTGFEMCTFLALVRAITQTGLARHEPCGSGSPGPNAFTAWPVVP